MLIAAAEAAFDDFLNRCAATGFWRPDSDPLITALSGGPDSTALALIADKRARARNIPHRALIIDHGLRDNSSQEAQQVAVLMRGKSIATDILKIGLLFLPIKEGNFTTCPKGLDLIIAPLADLRLA